MGEGRRERQLGSFERGRVRRPLRLPRCPKSTSAGIPCTAGAGHRRMRKRQSGDGMVRHRSGLERTTTLSTALWAREVGAIAADLLELWYGGVTLA